MVFKVLELVVFPSLDKIVYRFFYGFLTFCFFGDNYCICNIVHLFIFSFKWGRIFCRYWPLLISGMSHGKWGCIKGMGFCILMCINYWKDHKVTWIPKGMWICTGYNAMHWTGLDWILIRGSIGNHPKRKEDGTTPHQFHSWTGCFWNHTCLAWHKFYIKINWGFFVKLVLMIKSFLVLTVG